MELKPVKYFENEEETLGRRLELIKLIMEPYVSTKSEEMCGERFNILYEKSLPELKIYYQVFK